MNSSNVITKGKARLNRMLNGRDRHQQSLTVRKVDGPLLAGRPAVGGGAGPAWPGGISTMITSTKSMGRRSHPIDGRNFSIFLFKREWHL